MYSYLTFTIPVVWFSFVHPGSTASRSPNATNDTFIHWSKATYLTDRDVNDEHLPLKGDFVDLRPGMQKNQYWETTHEDNIAVNKNIPVNLRRAVFSTSVARHGGVSWFRLLEAVGTARPSFRPFVQDRAGNQMSGRIP